MELTYYFGYSYKEISEIVGCPENTVKTRMYHGKQRLMDLLGESGRVQLKNETREAQANADVAVYNSRKVV